MYGAVHLYGKNSFPVGNQMDGEFPMYLINASEKIEYPHAEVSFFSRFYRFDISVKSEMRKNFLFRWQVFRYCQMLHSLPVSSGTVIDH